MGRLWSRLPMGVVVALLFAAGAYRANQDPGDFDGVTLMAVSLILTGIWIAVELHDRWGDHKDP